MIRLPLPSLLLCAALLMHCGGDAVEESAHLSPSRYIQQGRGERVLVFVHGILGDATETWRSPNGIYFPDLVANDLELAGNDVYVYDYPSRFFSTGPFSLAEIAANMENRLRRDKVFESHKEVVFVCHSMGGLVVEQLLLSYRDLAAKVPLLVLYSTPQTGAEIAKFGSVFSKSRQLEVMIPGEDNQYLENLERQWNVAGFNTKIRCAYERRKTQGELVVGRASGTRLCDGSAVPIDADHMGIVKPQGRNADAYIALFNWVKQIDSITAPVNMTSSDGFVNMETPSAMTLADLVGVLEEREEITIAFRGCPDSLLSMEVPRGTYEGTSIKELLENVRLRIKAREAQYTVQVVKEGLRYEIVCG